MQPARIGTPAHFEIEEGGGTLRIRWKWPRLLGAALAVGAAGWNTVLYFWFTGLPAQEAAARLFAIPHLIAGLVAPYVAVAFLFNSTIVEVAGGELRVTHQPVPFPGNRTLTARDVRQLFSVERHGRKGSVTFDVMALLASDRETKLVTGLSDQREAQFLEQRIESRLRLADQPIVGELPR